MKKLLVNIFVSPIRNKQKRHKIRKILLNISTEEFREEIIPTTTTQDSIIEKCLSYARVQFPPELRIQYETYCQKLKEKLPQDRLENYEFKVYAQNGEDGVIEEIFNRIGFTNKSFVEFGVEIGVQCNTVFLLCQGWNGLWIDGNEQCCTYINETFNHYIQDKKLHIKNAFITRDNINDLIAEYYTGEIDLLSIDIDRNDYDVWEAIECIQPRVVVAEYNAKFPPYINWHVPYQADEMWDFTDYCGMTLLAAAELGKRKGYVLVGTETNGVNCFFVRKDVFDKVQDRFNYPMSVKDLWNPARYHLVGISPSGNIVSCKFPKLMRQSGT